MGLLSSLTGRHPRRQSPSARCVVYTCLFGYSERFNDFPYERDGTVDFICFTDDPELRSSVWRIVHVPRGLLDPARAAKRIKILAHRFVSQYESSLYVDNIVFLKQRPREVFERFLHTSSSPLVCFRHPWRQCIYDAAEAVIALNFDVPQRVNEQMAGYRRLGYPSGNGLTKSGFMLRRHNDPALIAVMESWFEQILRHSHRDQLSFKFAAWIHDFEPTTIELDFLNNDVLEWLVASNRLPRDFNDACYLRLHPDVAAAGVDPRKHYFFTGAAEGRAYR